MSGCVTIDYQAHKYFVVQDANKSIDELEILKGTLQPDNGIHMICTPRTCNEE